MDIWLAGNLLTCDDNLAFVKQFRLAVVDTAARLRSGEGSPLPFAGLSPEGAHRGLMLRAGHDDETEADYQKRSQFRGLSWGPTTDNVTAHLFRDVDCLVITMQFVREEHLLKHPEYEGEVFVVRISTAEFVGLLEDLVALLDSGQKQDCA
ncbi:hypothetical protein [Streptomyces sp. NBC_00467]|uniref:hypothetical protein n=1 Tax=Streptomyces sp. NBC_00467 TaxID=2975752 RepID=UPI002E19C18E